jgi:hypothetical protein
MAMRRRQIEESLEVGANRLRELANRFIQNLSNRSKCDFYVPRLRRSSIHVRERAIRFGQKAINRQAPDKGASTG